MRASDRESVLPDNRCMYRHPENGVEPGFTLQGKTDKNGKPPVWNTLTRLRHAYQSLASSSLFALFIALIGAALFRLDALDAARFPA